MTIQREILFPVFLECATHTNEPFWQTVFKDMAYGKTPYGTYFNNGFLCCSYKKKKFSYKMEDNDSLKMYHDIRALLSNKLGLMSQDDKISKRGEFEQIQASIAEGRETWMGIRNKKNFKELLLEKFVLDKRREFSLTMKQAKLLLALIFIAIAFKVIKTKDIEYDGVRITKIEGITFRQGKVILKHDIYNIDAAVTPEIIISQRLMSDNWEKYLNLLRKSNKTKSITCE